MAVNDFIAKDYLGSAVATTLNGAISSSVTTIVVTSGAGLPDGSAGPFVVSIDRTTLPASEEKVIVTSRSGNTLTVLQRGYDGTTGVSHLTLASVEHVLDAMSIKQANAFAAAASIAGSMAYRSAASAYTEIPIAGSTGKVLASDGTRPLWQVVSDIQVFLVSGTWSKPAGLFTKIDYVVINGGWGGTAGSGGAPGAGGGGGNGGAPGGSVEGTCKFSALGASEAITVGVGGLGGSSQGAPGLVGGQSSIGTKIKAPPSASSSLTNVAGAGGKGGLTAGSAAVAGDAGSGSTGGAAGTTGVGSAGGAAGVEGTGGGGGGGGGSTSSTGSVGGTGGVPGGGGGGGGAGATSGQFGNGGPGGAGLVMIICS